MVILQTKILRSSVRFKAKSGLSVSEESCAIRLQKYLSSIGFDSPIG